MQKVIAIDGPSGSGKSTMAKNLAQELNILYIDTGAMYRALAYSAHSEKIPFEEGPQLETFLNQLKIDYTYDENVEVNVNGQNLSQKIRDHEVSALASVFSQLPSVRKFLIQFQRELGQERICVMEGRDIGTVVFPHAFCKIFVTASPEVRAQRRLEQLEEQGAEGLTLDQVLKDVLKRDELDTQRKVSPLKVADSAVVLDTSDMKPEEVLNRLVEISKDKAKGADLSL